MAESSTPDPSPHATVVFVGHHGSGKSTAAGHLLVKLGGVDRRMWERVERETSNRPTSRYAWVVDRLRAERDRGTTLDLKLHPLELPPPPAPASPASPGDRARLAVTLVDTPGHPDCLRSTIAGITQADVAVLVVDSRPAVLESPSCRTQTRDLAQLATALANQRHLVVAVNFLDVAVESDPALVEQRFRDATEAIKRIIKRQAHPPVFVPVSAYAGDNLVEPSHRMTWWSGHTLTDALATAVAAAVPPAARAAAAALPLRIPLIGVFKVGGIGTVPAGRLAGGSIRCGASALLRPPSPAAAATATTTTATGRTTAATAAAGTSATAVSGGTAAAADVCVSGGSLAAVVRSVESFRESRGGACAGEWVGLAVKGVHQGALRRGCVVSDAADRPARLAESFTAKVQVLRDPTSKREGRARSLRPGYTALVHVHTAQAPCRLMSIRRCNAKGEVVDAAAPCLCEGDIAEVELQPLTPLVVEPFRDIPALGRFAVRAAVRAEGHAGANGGGAGGGGGPAGQSAAAMTPVIVALGRVEAVKYVEELGQGVTSPRGGSRRTSQAGKRGGKGADAATAAAPAASTAVPPHAGAATAAAEEAAAAATVKKAAAAEEAEAALAEKAAAAAAEEATADSTAAAEEAVAVPTVVTFIDVSGNGDGEEGL